MKNLLSKSAIKPFVKGVLGCSCPEEVFQSIESGWHDLRGQPYQRVLVGNRLLVYLIGAKSLRSGTELLGAFVDRGMRERDLHGYNRVRLVVIGDSAQQERQAFIRSFLQISSGDHKAHIHFVTPLELRAVLRHQGLPFERSAY